MASTFYDMGLTSPGPHSRANGLRKKICAVRVLWAGLLRPTLGLIRHGRFRDVNLSRTGVIPAGGTDTAL